MSVPSSCSPRHTVEWRQRPSSSSSSSAPSPSIRLSPHPRAAVCLLGVPRFIDVTVGRLRQQLLQRLGRPYDLFTYASGGRHGVRACKEVRIRGPGDRAVPDLRNMLVLGDGTGDGVYPNELEALSSLLEESVAGQLVFDDRPVEALTSEAAGHWRRALRRQGTWLGGMSTQPALGPGAVVRPGSGLAQLQSLQWCADAVRRHELEVLGHQYEYVVYSRWDLQWLLPFPGLPLLQASDRDAVWVPATQGDYFANDRFAAVPREAVSAYFEGWTALRDGWADDIFEEVVPWVGQPDFTAGLTTEGFLFARLNYAGVKTSFLPTLAYIACEPTANLQNLRTLGYRSCTSFSKYFAMPALLSVPLHEDSSSDAVLTSPNASQALLPAAARGADLQTLRGGLKYPRELDSIVMTDNVVRTLNTTDEAVQLPSLRDVVNDSSHILRLFNIPFPQLEWTAQRLQQSAIAAAQQEADEHLARRHCLSSANVWQKGFECIRFLSRLYSLHSKTAFLNEALDLARALVLASPWHLQGWAWLSLVLLHPRWGSVGHAAAAVAQARALNATHPVVASLQSVIAGADLPLTDERPWGMLLDKALGGPNATRQFRRQRSLDLRLQRQRRQLQRRCRRSQGHERGQLTGASTALTTWARLEAWLDYGTFLLQSNWLTAAVGVLQCLPALEEVEAALGEWRSVAAAAAVADFRERLQRAVEQTEKVFAQGTRLEDLALHAPSCAQLLDPAWLEDQEALAFVGGRDVRGQSLHGLVYRYSGDWKTMVAMDLA